MSTGNGGTGGTGGRSVKTYSSGSLTSGAGITVVVGQAGGGGYGAVVNHNGSPGSDGSVSISWSDPPPATCSVTLTPSTINQGQSSTLSWTSSNADTSVYINNVGYVSSGGSSSSGSFSVAPSSTTDYACYATGAGGSDGWHSSVLTVHPSCSFNGTTVTHGSSLTAYQASTVAYGSSCVSQTRTCSDGTLSGSYTYASCTVDSPANCSLNGTTVNHGATVTAYSTETAPSGQFCSSLSESRACSNGTLSGSSSYTYASCSCTAQTSWTCPTTSSIASTTITAACGSSTANTSCSSPSFCSTGSSVCLYPSGAFDPFTSDDGDSLDGTLIAAPELLPEGTPTRLYWSVENMESCTIGGTNGQSWSSASSGSSGQPTANINEQTLFTLSCTGYPGASPATLSDTAVVNVLPVFEEN